MTRNPMTHRTQAVSPVAASLRSRPAEPGRDRRLQAVPARRIAPSVAWWGRDFRGGADQVRLARHWIEDLLPECDPLQDILLLVSELCANAVTHTRSREAGGRFSVDVEWGPELARVVIGDQGSLTVPAIGGKPGESAGTEEDGRGLLLVDELADDWGTCCHPAGRVVWVEVQWQARGGPALNASGDSDAVVADVTAMRSELPGITIWWGHQTEAWWAALPVVTDASNLFSSPTTDGLRKLVTDACSQSGPDDCCDSPPAIPPTEAVALAPNQPDTTQGRR